MCSGVSDPRSQLSKGHIVATCRQCHPGVDAKFADLPAPTRTRSTRVNYPALHQMYLRHDGAADRRLRLLRRCTRFSGSSAPVYLYLHDSKTFREAKVQAQRRRREVHALSRPLTGSCTCWWSRASCCSC